MSYWFVSDSVFLVSGSSVSYCTEQHDGYVSLARSPRMLFFPSPRYHSIVPDDSADDEGSGSNVLPPTRVHSENTATARTMYEESREFLCVGDM